MSNTQYRDMSYLNVNRGNIVSVSIALEKLDSIISRLENEKPRLHENKVKHENDMQCKLNNLELENMHESCIVNQYKNELQRTMLKYEIESSDDSIKALDENIKIVKKQRHILHTKILRFRRRLWYR